MTVYNGLLSLAQKECSYMQSVQIATFYKWTKSNFPT